MKIVHDPAELRAACDRARADGLRVGFVPTMGALHEGHLRLTATAARRADFTVVSIFVNPTQFGPNEDLARYPRTFDADCDQCRAAGVSLLFAPAAEAMYPPGEETRVRVGQTARFLCGAHRPGHFEGVCTVVGKLLALVGPCALILGRKDYQQLRVLSRMVADLLLPVEVVGVPIVREPDGLALSSRNRYLSPQERERALGLARGLSAAVRAFEAGERRAGELLAMARAEIAPVADSIDYLEVADADTVVPLRPDALSGERALCAAAARFGGTRLIDNAVLGEDPAPLSSWVRAP